MTFTPLHLIDKYSTLDSNTFLGRFPLLVTLNNSFKINRFTLFSFLKCEWPDTVLFTGGTNHGKRRLLPVSPVQSAAGRVGNKEMETPHLQSTQDLKSMLEASEGKCDSFSLNIDPALNAFSGLQSHSVSHCGNNSTMS